MPALRPSLLLFFLLLAVTLGSCVGLIVRAEAPSGACQIRGTADWQDGPHAAPCGHLEPERPDPHAAGPSLGRPGAGGSSGAGVLNERGELVGVIIQGGADWGSDTVDCRKLADTNEDGEVDDLDTCIRFGGFINAALSLYDVRVFLGAHGALVEVKQ